MRNKAKCQLAVCSCRARVDDLYAVIIAAKLLHKEQKEISANVRILIAADLRRALGFLKT